MFLIYSLLAVLAYSLHNVFMAPLYREFKDKLSAVFYRGICISLSASPILFFVSEKDFQNIPSHFSTLTLASILAVVGTWAAIYSVNFLAVGIANTLLIALSNLFVVLVSVFLLGETLSLNQYFLIPLIISSVLVFGLVRAKGALPVSYNAPKGVLCCATFGIFTGTAYVLMGLVSRESNPLLVGYLWESLIGLVAGIAACARLGLARIQKLPSTFETVSFYRLKKVFICSAPAGIGTALYALAMTEGSIAIAAAILNLSMVSTTLLAVVLYSEKLTRTQWGLLLLISVLVIGLRV